jgi:succinate dehydrogenase / fumarate reductase cytochrome b subunit
MAFTGLVLIFFLLMHMFGNLKVFVGQEAYNFYAGWLKAEVLYPILPHGWFIWIFRVFLLTCLVLHVYCMATLWAASLRGRGSSYVRTNRRQQTWSSKFMRWLGLTLATLLLLHLLMFTIGGVTFGAFEFVAHDPYSMFIGAFSQWWIVLIYAIFVGAVCMHVRHGFYSAFTTLGINVGPGARQTLNVLAYFVAGLLFAGFILPPLGVLLGMV